MQSALAEKRRTHRDRDAHDGRMDPKPGWRKRNSMSPGILGKKIGMTQVFNADGQVIPVTLVKAGPCVVTQRKTPAIDGYDAVQLGLVEYAKKQNKPLTNHLKKSGAEGVKFLHEFRLDQGTG